MNENKYFPDRYMNHQHFAKRMIKSFDKKELRSEKGFCSRLQNFLTKETGQIPQKIDRKYILAYGHIIFWHGRNIFETPPNLVRLLSKTEVDNVRFRDILLPYQEMYIHFGEVKDIVYDVNRIDQNLEKYYLEGAYVMDCGTYFDFITCYKSPKDDFSQQTNALYDDRLQAFEFSLDCDDPENDTVGKCFIDFVSERDRMLEEYRCDEIASGDKSGEFAMEFAIISKSIKLILNTICYINAFRNDVKVTSTNEQATELLRQLEQTKKSRKRTKITQKLSKLSYSRIHLLGQNLQNEYERLSTGREVEPHWRRGHWRNQPYGKGLLETKLIWIKPTIIRKDKGCPNKGHIYELKK
jgi:hypothetical protein